MDLGGFVTHKNRLAPNNPSIRGGKYGKYSLYSGYHFYLQWVGATLKNGVIKLPPIDEDAAVRGYHWIHEQPEGQL